MSFRFLVNQFSSMTQQAIANLSIAWANLGGIDSLIKRNLEGCLYPFDYLLKEKPAIN